MKCINLYYYYLKPNYQNLKLISYCLNVLNGFLFFFFNILYLYLLHIFFDNYPLEHFISYHQTYTPYTKLCLKYMCSIGRDSKQQELFSILLKLSITYLYTIEKNNHNIVLNSILFSISSNYLLQSTDYSVTFHILSYLYNYFSILNFKTKHYIFYKVPLGRAFFPNAMIYYCF